MMPYLDAALAFTLTMFVVAMLVTQIVNVIQRAFKARGEGLQKMLKEYFDSELQPVVQRELNRLKTTIGDQVVSGLNEALAKFDASLEISKEAEKEMLDYMSTEELIERLKRSKFGQKLLTDLGDKAQTVFNELGTRYEVVGSKFTESFRKNSRTWTTVVALVLALVINVDSIHIANTYIQNQSIRQAVIDQKDAFVHDYNALVKTLEEEQGKDSFTKSDLEQAFKDSREQLNLITSTGFPVGWSYFPHSYFQGEDVTSTDFQKRNNIWGWFTWVFGVLITGALAGLGGPFWYDALSGMTRFVQSTRATKKTERS